MGRSSGDGPTVAPLADPLEEARPLFAFVGAFLPPAAHAGWGARDGDRLVGAILVQRAGPAAMLHGPVVALGGAAKGEPTVMDNAVASVSEPAEAVALGGAAKGEPTVMDNAVASVSEPAEARAEAIRSRAEDPSRATLSRADDPLDPLAVADRLLTEVLARANADGIQTVFARPQGLDRLWVRAGFIPVPEVELPAGLRGCPGVGLHAWRGGTAIWSAAGRAAAAVVTGGEGAGGGRAGGRGGRRPRR